MLEKQIEAKVCEYAKTKGVLVYKFTSPARAAVPDRLMTIPGLRLIQVNTDGLTVRVPRSHKVLVDLARMAWQERTGLNLEEAIYKAMMIRDVNNYIAIYEDGGTKRKGAYEWKVGWHQNAGGLVIPKVAEKVLVEGAPIRQTVMQ